VGWEIDGIQELYVLTDRTGTRPGGNLSVGTNFALSGAMRIKEGFAAPTFRLAFRNQTVAYERKQTSAVRAKSGFFDMPVRVPAFSLRVV
jgi:hypothetical protein